MKRFAIQIEDADPKILMDALGDVQHIRLTENAAEKTHHLTLQTSIPKIHWLLWKKLMPTLPGKYIVTCEGENGWEDYRLLYHYDPAQQLDEMT